MSRGWLWLLGGLGGLLALAAGMALAWWAYLHVVVTIPLRDQPIGVDLPEKFQAVIEVTNDLEVAMQGEITTSVPFKQPLTVPFRGRYDFDVDMQARVPIAFDVAFDGIIAVDTEAEVTIRTSINYKNLKALRNLKIETTLPLQFPLPVKLNIPVDDVIDLNYSGPLAADINQDIQTQVDTVLRTRLPIDQTISTPVTAALELDVWPDDSQVRLILSEMLIDLRPSTMLRFSLPEERDGPERVDNPYGPRDGAARESAGPADSGSN